MRRRSFLKGIAASAGLALSTRAAGSLFAAAAGSNERVQVAVAGVHGRGNNLLKLFSRSNDVDVRYVCDVDANVLGERTAWVQGNTRHRPEAIGDFRRALDDPKIDALVLGTPDHWHAIPTIHACMAGKDVYIEKPDGHNVLESLTMAAAQRRHKRVVQLGTQARSAVHMLEAMEYIAAGALGNVRHAMAWESDKQGNIGRPKDTEPPEGVDYDFWLGPAPKRSFNPKRFHEDWRWFFDYGTGDLGNDGVHRIDYARWGLETALAAEGKTLPLLPERTSAHGGKLYFDDMQEWPDTLLVTYDYGEALLSYEMKTWTPYTRHGLREGAAIYGDKGFIVLGNRDWTAYDEDGETVKEFQGGGNLNSTTIHVRDFLDCVRSRRRAAADLETIGHPSSMMCHLGNAAWRAGKTLTFRAESRSFGDPAADRYLTRPQYRKPWELPTLASF